MDAPVLFGVWLAALVATGIVGASVECIARERSLSMGETMALALLGAASPPLVAAIIMAAR